MGGRGGYVPACFGDSVVGASAFHSSDSDQTTPPPVGSSLGVVLNPVPPYSTEVAYSRDLHSFCRAVQARFASKLRLILWLLIMCNRRQCTTCANT